MNGLLGLMILVSLGQTPGQPGGTAAAKDAGVAALFNGKDLTGWADALDNASDWQVIDGVLVGRGGGPGQPAVLVTERQDFKNYRLRVTYAFAEPGAGGVELRRSGEAAITNCYVVSVPVSSDPMAKERPAGYVTKLVGYRYGQPYPPARPVTNRVDAPASRWHTLVITVNGNRVTTALDGQPADDFIDRKQVPKPGGIALLCRGNSVIRVRDVQIQELPAD
jgi:hypothetical protein